MASVMEKSQAGKGTGVLEGGWSRSTGGETAASGLASSAQLPGEVAGPTAGPRGLAVPHPAGAGGRHAVGGWSRCAAGGDVPAPASPARSLPGAAALAAVTSVFPSHRRFTNGGTPRAPAARSARQGRPPSPTGPLGFLQCRGGPNRGRCCHPGSVQWGSSSAKSLLGFLSYSFPPKVFILFLKTKFKENFFFLYKWCLEKSRCIQ